MPESLSDSAPRQTGQSLEIITRTFNILAHIITKTKNFVNLYLVIESRAV